MTRTVLSTIRLLDEFLKIAVQKSYEIGLSKIDVEAYLKAAR